METTTPYSPSWKVGVGIFAAPVLVSLGAFVLGGLYSAITVFVPIVGIVTVIALFLMAFALMLLVGFALRLGKSRNPIVDHLMGLLTGVVALYSAWAFFIYFVINQVETIGLLECFNPLFLVFAIYEIGQTGWYEIKGSTPSGWFLYGIWLVEAAILVGTPTLFARTQNEGPFCEKGGAWADEFRSVHLVGENLTTDFPTLIREWRLEDMMALEPYDPGYPALISIEGAWCGCCNEFATVRVQKIVLSTNDKGELEKNITTIVPPHEVSPEQLRMLDELVDEAAMGQAAEEALEPVEPDFDDESIDAVES